jgi:LacI family gluconate utilization system Gnt-I transcriptional repressor
MLRRVISAPAAAIRLSDVAAAASVSPMTASRALRTPEKVALETRQRVEAAARSLGYVPNLVAGALASAQSRTVGVLVPTITSSIFATTVNGLTAGLEEAGYAILIAQSGYDAVREERALAALLGRRPEAVAMVGSPRTAAAQAMLRRSAESGITVVQLWELPDEPIGFAVGFDNAAAGRAVAAHFVAAGRKRLAFVGGEDARAAERCRGFTEGACTAGLARPLSFVLPVPASMDDAAAFYDAAARKSRGLLAADAVFAATDVHAVGLLTALRQHRLRVPEEVAVIGLGDLDIARHTVPPLTTLRIDGAQIGRRAAAIILGQATKDAAAQPARIDTGFHFLQRGSG